MKRSERPRRRARDGEGQGAEPGSPRPAGGARDLEFDHVAIAVDAFEEILPLLERLGRASATRPRTVESQGVEVRFVGEVEIIRPLADDNGVARFIERRGPGLHHIAYRVPDLAKLMDELTEEGYAFTSDAPMTGAGGHRIAFLHPRSAGGVLVELVERERP